MAAANCTIGVTFTPTVIVSINETLALGQRQGIEQGTTRKPTALH